MESAKFRFTDELTVAMEFDANISTIEDFRAALFKTLTEYKDQYPNKKASIHMYHRGRWMPLNKTGGCNSILAQTNSPQLWCERIAQELLDLWSETVRYSDRIDSLISIGIRASKL